MLAFDPVPYAVVNYYKQCTNPGPPTQSARNEQRLVFLLSLQWAAIQID